MPDLKGMNIEALQQHIAQAQEVLAAKVADKRADLMAQLEALDAVNKKPVQRRTARQANPERAPVKPLYQGPKGETWAGRGAAPRWLVALEAEGKSRENYRIKEGAE